MATKTSRRMAWWDGEREEESEKRLMCSVIWFHYRRPRELRRSAVCSSIGVFRKIFSSGFPLRSRHPPQTVFLCPFILSFLSRVSTHERFMSRVKDTRLLVLYHDRSSGHDTTLHTEFLDHRPSIRRGLGILMILRYYRRKHLIWGENWPILRETHVWW